MEKTHHRQQLRSASVPAGTQKRVMPVGDGARESVTGEIGGQEAILRGAFTAASDLSAVAVERDEMPIADVVLIPAFVPGADRDPFAGEIIEVPGRESCLVLMIPRDGVRDVVEPTPCRVVTLVELSERPRFVLQIAQRKDDHRRALGLLRQDEIGGVLGPAGHPGRRAVAGDISRGHDHGQTEGRRRGCGRQRVRTALRRERPAASVGREYGPYKT